MMMLPLLANLLGKIEEEAIHMIGVEKLVIRVLKEDDKSFFETCDHHTDRINLHLKDGKVIKAFVG